jgi:hypothetical protein
MKDERLRENSFHCLHQNKDERAIHVRGKQLLEPLWNIKVWKAETARTTMENEDGKPEGKKEKKFNVM